MDKRVYYTEEYPDLWGVLNITPDSFSDGGLYFETSKAFDHATHLIEGGAAVIDIGAESTRPAGHVYGQGFEPMSAHTELSRLLPVLDGLVALNKTQDVSISIDTSKGEVALACLTRGAQIINDVQGGRDESLLEAVAEHGAQLVLMHNRQQGELSAENTDYGANLSDTVFNELMERVDRALSLGVHHDRIYLGPGLGFAKTHRQSLELVQCIANWTQSEYRVLVGASRKSFLTTAIGEEGMAVIPQDRLPMDLAVALHCADAGVNALRVHDPLATKRFLRMNRALKHA